MDAVPADLEGHLAALAAPAVARLDRLGCTCFVGVDVEPLSRWRRLVEHPARLAPLFHEEEHAHCRTTPGRAAVCYAGRWCAKEAVFKAVSRAHRVDLRDIVIRTHADGAPYAEVRKHGLSLRPDALSLSLSFTGTHAFAVALYVERPATA